MNRRNGEEERQRREEENEKWRRTIKKNERGRENAKEGQFWNNKKNKIRNINQN